MKKRSFPIIIGKTQISPLIREQGYACVNYSGMKSMMGAVIGKSGSGKSYSLASLIFSTFANSILEGKNRKISVIDPHGNLIGLLINGLVRSFYEFDPDHTRASTVLTYSHPLIGGFGYVPSNGSILKAFRFNPIVPFSDGKDGYISPELQVEWLLASLQSVFAVSDFGARNLLATGTIARMYLAFNKNILEGKAQGPYFTMKDLADLFLYLSNSGTLPDYVDDNLSRIDSKISESLRPSLKKMVQNVKTDKSYFDSVNTKFGMFLLELNEQVFGVGIGPQETQSLFDVAASLLKPQTETVLETFDLSGFGEEKAFIASCLINAAYYFGKKRPIPSASDYLLVIDEFRSLISLRTDTLYFTVQKLLFEARKYSIGILPVFQELTDSVKTLFSNFSFVLVFALRQDAATKIVADLNAGISGGIQILPEHISNLGQGQFFGRFDTKKNGVLTILAKSIDFSKQSEISEILKLTNTPLNP